MDMSLAFINRVEEHLHTATIIFDKYHILKIISTAINQVRKNGHRRPNKYTGVRC
jgi:transposase